VPSLGDDAYLSVDVETSGPCPTELINLVNNLFYEKLTAIPSLEGYIGTFQDGRDER